MSQIFTLAGGELSMWLDDSGSVMLKINSQYRDPIELSEGELDELIQLLTDLRKQMED